MRALLAACGLLGALAFPSAAGAFPVSVSATSGVMLGGAKEFVLINGYTLSELDWPLLPAFYAGLVADFGSSAGFQASVELQLGIPGYAGTMTDSDFENFDGVKTRLSVSDGDMESAVLASARVGWGFPVGGTSLSFEPFLAFEYIRLAWTAQNGYLQYPPETSAPFTPWSPSTPKTPVYGTGIIYTQNYLIPAAGIKGTFSLSDSLSMSASFVFSPYLWCFDKDSHLLRQLDFYTYMYGGLLLEPQLSATYRISSGTAVSLAVVYRHITITGDEYVEGTGASGYSPPPSSPLGVQLSESPYYGGASLDVVSITVSLSLQL